VLEGIRHGRSAAVVTEVQAPRPGAETLVTPAMTLGSLGDPALDRATAGDARLTLVQGATGVGHYGIHREGRGDAVEVFVRSFELPARMYVFGAIDFSGATDRMRRLVGYRVTVCDAGTASPTRTRFPGAWKWWCSGPTSSWPGPRWTSGPSSAC
jgi:xanthine dehydrogenase accessory factor